MGKFALTLTHKESSGPRDIHAVTNKGVLICRFLQKGDSSLQRM